jgi:hypothetical protein
MLAGLGILGWAGDCSADDAPAVPEVDSSFALYRGQEHFKAMAQGDENLFFVSHHQCSPERAINKALQECRESPLHKSCKLIAVGDVDVSGLDERGLARMKREYAISGIPVDSGSADGVNQIPALLAGRNTPYLTGVASGFFVYGHEARCIAAVWAYVESDFICMGVTQFRERTGLGNTAALGTVDFTCTPNLEILGRYVRVTEGTGLAVMSDGKGGEIYAVYGTDIPRTHVSMNTFLRLWRVRAAATSGVPGFPTELDLQE